MLTSIRTTSGWHAPATADRLVAGRRLADELDVRRRRRAAAGGRPGTRRGRRRPGRGSLGPGRCDVLLAHVAAGPERQPGEDARPALRPPLDRAPRRPPPRRARASTPGPCPRRGGPGRRVPSSATSIVELAAGGEPHAARARAGVADGVGHRLDRDPVGGDLDRGRQLGQRRRVALDADRGPPRHRRSAPPSSRARLLADRAGQPQLVERRRPQPVDQPPDVGERLAHLGRQRLELAPAPRPGRRRAPRRTPRRASRSPPASAPARRGGRAAAGAAPPRARARAARATGRGRRAAACAWTAAPAWRARSCEQRELVVAEAALAAPHAEHQPPDRLRAVDEVDRLRPSAPGCRARRRPGSRPPRRSPRGRRTAGAARRRRSRRSPGRRARAPPPTRAAARAGASPATARRASRTCSRLTARWSTSRSGSATSAARPVASRSSTT